ncbi:hypothetical protein AcW1_004515 [Taiwanofungus camphoratus]|nr:hypothetical protein AcW2_006482 [Antrodia cinnamomea]KAI0952411.1 hypothetical protein AcV7_008226 [Antrodia cinnamomea]KAI0959787.1 hypothetical protein AcW1_004515 [Antrodia cinnamomea]
MSDTTDVCVSDHTSSTVYATLSTAQDSRAAGFIPRSASRSRSEALHLPREVGKFSHDLPRMMLFATISSLISSSCLQTTLVATLGLVRQEALSGLVVCTHGQNGLSYELTNAFPFLIFATLDGRYA